MRDLRKEIRKINEEIGKEELNTKNPYFQYLYKRFANLQIELDDYEFELKKKLNNSLFSTGSITPYTP